MRATPLLNVEYALPASAPRDGLNASQYQEAEYSCSLTTHNRITSTCLLWQSCSSADEAARLTHLSPTHPAPPPSHRGLTSERLHRKSRRVQKQLETAQLHCGLCMGPRAERLAWPSWAHTREMQCAVRRLIPDGATMSTDAWGLAHRGS